MINAFSPEIFAYQEIPNFVSEKELKQNKQIDYAFAIKYNLPIKKITFCPCQIVALCAVYLKRA